MPIVPLTLALILLLFRLELALVHVGNEPSKLSDVNVRIPRVLIVDVDNLPADVGLDEEGTVEQGVGQLLWLEAARIVRVVAREGVEDVLGHRGRRWRAAGGDGGEDHRKRGRKLSYVRTRLAVHSKEVSGRSCDVIAANLSKIGTIRAPAQVSSPRHAHLSLHALRTR